MRLGLVFHLFRTAARIQRKRMVLTVSAIAWGTISILLLLSFGEGLRRSLGRGRAGLGEGIAITWNGETQKPYAGFPPGRPIRLVPEDVELLRGSIPEIEKASGEMRTFGAQLGYGGLVLNKRVTGVEPVYGELRNEVPEEGGRFVDPLDIQLKRRVIFLGNDVRDELFGEGFPAVGEVVSVNRVPFTVVGVLRKKLQMGAYGGPDASGTFIPLTTFQAVMGRRTLSNVVFKPASPELMEVAKRRFYEVLGAKYRFDPTDERALPIWDTQEGQRVMANMMIGINAFLAIIGSLTLIIGGVGVANIMFAAVAHRTRELGIQMALGARRSYIMGPVVLEALVLTLVGGFLGIGIGGATVEALAALQARAQSQAMEFLGQPTLSLGVALGTVSLLGAIGVLAGYFPARRILRIEPAAVLRHE